MYYLRSRSAVDAVKVTVSSEKVQRDKFVNNDNEDDDCLECSA